MNSSLNPEKFVKYLQGYWDWQIPYFVKFGFPLDIRPGAKFQDDLINHPSTENFSQHVDAYLEEEIRLGALVGPFEEPSKNLHVSPFMTR